MHHISYLTQLQYLDLIHCDKITDEGLCHVGHLLQLQTLRLYFV